MCVHPQLCQPSGCLPPSHPCSCALCRQTACLDCLSCSLAGYMIDTHSVTQVHWDTFGYFAPSDVNVCRRWHVVLLDSLRKRCDFLTRAAERIGEGWSCRSSIVDSFKLCQSTLQAQALIPHPLLKARTVQHAPHSTQVAPAVCGGADVLMLTLVPGAWCH